MLRQKKLEKRNMALMKKPRIKLSKPCRKCEKSFVPETKFTKLCFDCYIKSRIIATKNRIKTIEILKSVN